MAEINATEVTKDAVTRYFVLDREVSKAEFEKYNAATKREAEKTKKE